MSTNIRNNYRLLRNIIEQNFPLTDICPQYHEGMVGTTNTYCLWHPNHNTPSGKLYWDEDKGIVVFHCFAEHRTFTAYDYVKAILCDKEGKYEDPYEFLERNMTSQELREVIKLASYEMDEFDGSLRDKKVEYITNLYNEYDDVCPFIDELYSA